LNIESKVIALWEPVQDGDDLWRGQYRKHKNILTGGVIWLLTLAETRHLYVDGLIYCIIPVADLEPWK